MSQSRIRKHLFGSTAAYFVVAIASVGQATAQTSQSPAAAEAAREPKSAAQEEIVVTGSRIARAGYDTLQPAQVISAQTINDRGFINVGDALNELSAFGAPGSNNTGQQSGSNVGQQFVNLYGLGAQRTLVLVNGRRFVSGNAPTPPGTFGGPPAGQEVDLNNIPAGLVDRIEVLSVGGAPIYGADAIAGTVNIILKDKYQGVSLDGQYGISRHGDGESYALRALAGANFADDRGNVTTAIEYSDQRGLTYLNRPRTLPYGTFQPSDACKALGFSACYVPNATVPSIFPGGIPTINAGLANAGSPTYPSAIHNAAGQVVAFAPDGTLQPVNLGIQNNGLVFGSGGDGDNLAGQSSFIAPLKRTIISSLAHYDITDNVRAYVETEYSHSAGTQIAQQPSYQSAFFASQKGAAPIKFTTSNPFLNSQAAATLNAAGASTFYLSRANLDLAPQTFTNSIDTYRIVAGLKGKFDLFGRKINYDGSFNYGRSEGRETYYDINEANFLNAIDVVTNPATGQIACAVTVVPPPLVPGQGGQPSSVTQCQPLNLFGAGAPSKAARAFVTARDSAVSVLTQRDVELNANGSPFDLWAGPLQIAAGFEYREESGSYNVDAFAAAGLGRNAPSSSVAGGYHSTEFYAETTIPIVSPEMRAPLIYSLELEGSYRNIDNNLAGKADVYTMGGRYSPVKGLQFRGNFTHSVRAPSIEELFLPTTNTQSFAQDPCDNNFIAAKPNRAANCATAFTGLGVPLTGFKSQVVNASVLGTTGGNTSLLNESANAWTAGFVARPKFVPRLSVALDWIDIQLSNPITGLTLTQVMDACYDASGFPNSFCNLFTRNNQGQVTSFRTPLVNAGAQDFAGAQLDASYSLPVTDIPFISKVGLDPDKDYGTLSFDLNGFYEDRHSFTILGVTTPTKGNIGDPKWRINMTTRYRKGRLGVYFNTRYISSGAQDVTLKQSSQQILGVGDYWVSNASVSYDITKRITGDLIVSNIFDQDPPYYAITLGGGNALSQYDYFGQAFTFKLRVKL